MVCGYAFPLFRPGTKVISLVEHPPEVHPGTEAIIVKPWFRGLCAVQLPDGEIHRWFANFELQPVNSSAGYLAPGSLARVLNTVGHPPHIRPGMEVRIVRCFPQAVFYDLMINGKYHRWLAEWELAFPIA
ncbi:MAG TPA: hypothetical protein VHS59_12135 [Bacillota bacterium]|nr:hypothetical protein [Bacillota bacterium]